MTTRYACSLPLIDGLGYATWSMTVLFNRSRTRSFRHNPLFKFQALVALKLFISLLCHNVACGANIVSDRQTDRPTTVTLAVHARRGLIKQTYLLISMDVVGNGDVYRAY